MYSVRTSQFRQVQLANVTALDFANAYCCICRGEFILLCRLICKLNRPYSVLC